MKAKTHQKYDELIGLPKEYFSVNRENFIKNLKMRIPLLAEDSVLLLKGGDEIPRYDTDVNYYHFCQESNFYYLTGVREPGLSGVLDLKTGHCTLFYPQPPEDYRIWMKVVTREEMAKKYGLKVELLKDLNSFLQLRDMEKIYLLEGTNEYSGLPVMTAELNFEGTLAYLNKRITHDKMIYEVLCDTRSVKNQHEMEVMAYIAQITNEAHLEIMKQIKPALFERDMESVFLNYLSENYNTRIWAYPCIGGTGVNASTLHYDTNDSMMDDGDLFLADMGIRFCNYTSDVTITIPANGAFTQTQKEIYDIVLKANREVIKIMKPNVTTYFDMDKLSKRIILEELQKLGLIKKGFSIDELFRNEIWRIFMPHGLGHLVGLDVHDVGSKVSYKSKRILEEGNVITVEPGIYFIKWVLERAFADEGKRKYLEVEKLKEYVGFGGVRIEDDILITRDGLINLQGSLPRTTSEIEEFMSKNNIHLMNKN